MSVPGRRKSNPEGLPARVYRSRGWLFYADDTGKWHKLGREWDLDARRRWAELDAQPIPGTDVAGLIDRYIAACEAGKIRKAARTIADHHAEAVRLKAVFGRMRPADVKPTHVARFLDQHPAPVRANREAALLSSVFSAAMRWGLAEINPCYGVRRNPEHKRTRYVEGRELRAFGRQCQRWLRCYVLLKYLTGLRQGDMIALTRRAITPGRLVVETSKTGKVLRFKWSWALRIVINATLALQDPPRLVLFPSRFGTTLSPRGFKTAWSRAMRGYVEAGGAHFREHDIRAKNASDSATIGEAQERLGHT
ncbi:MAG TPA: tyrosine-type recombinase/integrase, partial [Burkholderiales bacterium]